MSTLEGDMMQPDRVGDDDPPAPEETTEQAETEQAAPPADDDISDADVIEVPDSSAQTTPDVFMTVSLSSKPSNGSM